MENRNLNIEFIEQPVHAKDWDGLKYVKDHVQTPIMADESIFSASDALKIVQGRYADLINIKLMKCGGIREAANCRYRRSSWCEMYGRKHDGIFFLLVLHI